MDWLYLILAGLFEIGWAVGIKYCDGFKLNLPAIIVAVSMTLSMVLWVALRTIPMSIAYSVWTGVGIVGVCAYDIWILKYPLSGLSIFFISMILFGIIGLKLSAAK